MSNKIYFFSFNKGFLGNICCHTSLEIIHKELRNNGGCCSVLSCPKSLRQEEGGSLGVQSIERCGGNTNTTFQVVQGQGRDLMGADSGSEGREQDHYITAAYPEGLRQSLGRSEGLPVRSISPVLGVRVANVPPVTGKNIKYSKQSLHSWLAVKINKFLLRHC